MTDPNPVSFIAFEQAAERFCLLKSAPCDDGVAELMKIYTEINGFWENCEALDLLKLNFFSETC